MGTNRRHPRQRSKNIGAQTSRRLKEQWCCALNHTRTYTTEQQEQTTALQLTGAWDSHEGSPESSLTHTHTHTHTYHYTVPCPPQ